MTASVLCAVVAYNNLPLTIACVDALRSQTIDVRVVVWDNASVDGTGDWLRDHPEIESVLSDVNVMWTPAVNAVFDVRWAGEPYLCMLNNDTAPSTTCLERMAAVAANPEVGLVGPVMDRIGGPQDAAWNAPTAQLPQELTANFPPTRVNYVMGACSMLRRDVWEHVGGLDYNMPLGADDHDYALRLKHAGYQIMVATSAFCRHGGHASANSGDEARGRWSEWGARSWSVFNEKWAGYFATEAEACAGHWDGQYTEGHDRGTGWSPEQCERVGFLTPRR